MKVDKTTAQKIRKLLADFSEMNNPVIYNTGLDAMERILDELKSTAPGELRKTIYEIKTRIGDIRLCLKKDESEMAVKELAVKFAIGVGVQFTLLCAELARARGTGRPKHPIDGIIRKLYAKKPSEQHKQIIHTAIATFEKDFPKQNHASVASLMARFPQIVARKS